MKMSRNIWRINLKEIQNKPMPFTFKEYESSDKIKGSADFQNVADEDLIAKVCSFKTIDVLLGEKYGEPGKDFHPFEPVFVEVNNKKALGIKASHYVGFLCCKGYLFKVKPKIEDADFFHMLTRVLLDMKISAVSGYEGVDWQLSFLAYAFVYFYKIMFEEKGLLREYCYEEENLSRIQGRIIQLANVRKNYGLKHRIFCGYDDYTLNTLHNQIIRYTQSLLLHNQQDASFSALSSHLRKIRTDLVDVDKVKILPKDFIHLRYNRLNEHYKEIHNICKLIILQKEAPETTAADETYGFFIDMNKLFERYIRILLEEAVKGLDFKIGYQDKSVFLYDKKHLIPDFTLRNDERVISVLDAKYKHIYDKDESDSAKSKDESTVDLSDLYQIITYCAKFHCRKAVLIYPQGSENIIKFKSWDDPIKIDKINFSIDENNNKDIIVHGWLIPLSNLAKGNTENKIIDAIGDKLRLNEIEKNSE